MILRDFVFILNILDVDILLVVYYLFLRSILFHPLPTKSFVASCTDSKQCD